MKNIRKTFIASAVAGAMAIFTACSSTSSLYHGDGRLATVASCSGPSWVSCYERAGSVCQAAGYETLEKLSSREVGFWSSADLKQIIFVCKAPLQHQPKAEGDQPVK